MVFFLMSVFAMIVQKILAITTIILLIINTVVVIISIINIVFGFLPRMENCYYYYNYYYCLKRDFQIKYCISFRIVRLEILSHFHPLFIISYYFAYLWFFIVNFFSTCIIHSSYTLYPKPGLKFPYFKIKEEILLLLLFSPISFPSPFHIIQYDAPIFNHRKCT